MILNFEFKARRDDIHYLEELLLKSNPEFKGEDHQVDTYFNVPNGRLKLREGNIENALIYYEREDNASAKLSKVKLFKLEPQSPIKEILIASLGVKMIIDKKRKIYFINNVKLHFDQVNDLGSFIEVEAIDNNGRFTIDELKEQCFRFVELFGIKPSEFISHSYSDLMEAKKYSKD